LKLRELRTWKFDFEALKMGAGTSPFDCRILWQPLNYVKLFFLPIGQAETQGYYHR